MRRWWSAIPALLAAGIFLLILGGRFVTIDRFVSDLPYWDQWDAGANSVVLPYLQGRLQPGDFFTPHNEHRIVWTKALSLALLILNGQWDVRLECLANAVWYAAIITAGFLLGCRMLPEGLWPAWVLVLAALHALPIAWQNAVGGFHSQQYFLLGFSVLAIVALTTSPAWTVRWWLGLASGGAALVSMGAGLLAAAAVAVSLLVCGRPRTVLPGHWPTLVGCVVLVATGWLSRAEVPPHAPLHVHSIGEFAASLCNQLQWPLRPHRWFGLLAWVPWAVHAGRTLFRHERATGGDRTVVAIGLWVLSLFLATAFARGAGGAWPDSRFVDNVLAGVAINLLVLLVAIGRARGSWRRLALWLAGAGLALAFAIPAYFQEIKSNLANELAPYRARMNRVENNIRAYVATDDASWLSQPDVAYPNAEVLQERLSHPEIRAVLPVSVRRSIHLEGTADPAGSFAPKAVAPEERRSDEVDHWGSFGEQGAESVGAWRSGWIGPSAFGYWRVEVTQRPAASRTSISLTGASEQDFHVVTAGEKDPGAWVAVDFPAPAAPGMLIASDADPAAWIGFTAPTEMATGSYWAARVSAYGWLIAAIGGVLIVVTFGGMAVMHGKGPRRRGPS
jgi:hypothetical protein